MPDEHGIRWEDASPTRQLTVIGTEGWVLRMFFEPARGSRVEWYPGGELTGGGHPAVAADVEKLQ